MIQQKILTIDLLASSKRHHPVSTVLHCNCNNIACQFLLVFFNHWCKQNVELLSNYLHSYSWWNPPSLCCYIFDTVHKRILIMQLKSNTNILAQVECQCCRLHITSIICCAPDVWPYTIVDNANDTNQTTCVYIVPPTV